MENIILGYGLLGKELVKQTNWDYLARINNNHFDFNKVNTYKDLIFKYNNVINCVANTDTYSNKKNDHWDVNYKSVSDLVELCNENNQKIVHISTDYLYSGSCENATEEDIPVHNKTWYGYTKLLGDAHIQLKSNDYLIIRTGHKVSPFIYEKAYDDLVGNFDYVKNIAKLIIKLIQKDAKGVFNVGTKYKSMYDLALITNPKVKRAKSENNLMPKNVSMNLSKMEKIL